MCAISDKTEARLSSVIRNGQWGQCWEGGGASEDPFETADADSSGAEGTATITLTHAHTCIYTDSLYVQTFAAETDCKNGKSKQ